MFLMFILQFLCPNSILVESHTKLTLEEIVHQKDLKHDKAEFHQIKPYIDEHHYYLPTQDGSHGLKHHASLTLPPNIFPSTAQSFYEKIPETILEKDSGDNPYLTPYLSNCESSIPSTSKIHSEYKYNLPSSETFLKSVVLSGESEIPSKTDSEKPVIPDSISGSSVPLQGVYVSMPSITDI